MAPIQGVPQDNAGGTTGARSSIPGGSELSAITAPVSLWHGLADKRCPPSHGRWLAKQILHVAAHFPADDDHTNIEEPTAGPPTRGSAGRSDTSPARPAPTGQSRSDPSLNRYAAPALSLSARMFRIVPICGQMYEPGCGLLEAAGIVVERSEVLFEVDVQPLAPGCLGVPGSVADKCRGDSLSLMLTGDLSVEEEGVITSVPCHVDEADQAAVGVAGGDPAKAVGPDLIPPSARGPAAVC